MQLNNHINSMMHFSPKMRSAATSRRYIDVDCREFFFFNLIFFFAVEQTRLFFVVDCSKAAIENLSRGLDHWKTRIINMKLLKGQYAPYILTQEMSYLYAYMDEYVHLYPHPAHEYISKR